MSSKNNQCKVVVGDPRKLTGFVCDLGLKQTHYSRMIIVKFSRDSSRVDVDIELHQTTINYYICIVCS